MMFVALAGAAKLRLSQFHALDLSNTAWAFAIAVQSDATLFVTVSRSAELRLGDFSAQNLANTS